MAQVEPKDLLITDIAIGELGDYEITFKRNNFERSGSSAIQKSSNITKTATKHLQEDVTKLIQDNFKEHNLSFAISGASGKTEIKATLSGDDDKTKNLLLADMVSLAGIKTTARIRVQFITPQPAYNPEESKQEEKKETARASASAPENNKTPAPTNDNVKKSESRINAFIGTTLFPIGQFVGHKLDSIIHDISNSFKASAAARAEQAAQAVKLQEKVASESTEKAEDALLLEQDKFDPQLPYHKNIKGELTQFKQTETVLEAKLKGAQTAAQSTNSPKSEFVDDALESAKDNVEASIADNAAREVKNLTRELSDLRESADKLVENNWSIYYAQTQINNPERSEFEIAAFKSQLPVYEKGLEKSKLAITEEYGTIFKTDEKAAEIVASLTPKEKADQIIEASGGDMSRLSKLVKATFKDGDIETGTELLNRAAKTAGGFAVGDVPDSQSVTNDGVARWAEFEQQVLNFQKAAHAEVRSQNEELIDIVSANKQFEANQLELQDTIETAETALASGSNIDVGTLAIKIGQFIDPLIFKGDVNSVVDKINELDKGDPEFSESLTSILTDIKKLSGIDDFINFGASGGSSSTKSSGFGVDDAVKNRFLEHQENIDGLQKADIEINQAFAALKAKDLEIANLKLNTLRTAAGRQFADSSEGRAFGNNEIPTEGFDPNAAEGLNETILPALLAERKALAFELQDAMLKGADLLGSADANKANKVADVIERIANNAATKDARDDLRDIADDNIRDEIEDAIDDRHDFLDDLRSFNELKLAKLQIEAELAHEGIFEGAPGYNIAFSELEKKIAKQGSEAVSEYGQFYKSGSELDINLSHESIEAPSFSDLFKIASRETNTEFTFDPSTGRLVSTDSAPGDYYTSFGTDGFAKAAVLDSFAKFQSVFGKIDQFDNQFLLQTLGGLQPSQRITIETSEIDGLTIVNFGTHQIKVSGVTILDPKKIQELRDSVQDLEYIRNNLVGADNTFGGQANPGQSQQVLEINSRLQQEKQLLAEELNKKAAFEELKRNINDFNKSIDGKSLNNTPDAAEKTAADNTPERIEDTLPTPAIKTTEPAVDNDAISASIDAVNAGTDTEKSVTAATDLAVMATNPVMIPVIVGRIAASFLIGKSMINKDEETNIKKDVYKKFNALKTQNTSGQLLIKTEEMMGGQLHKLTKSAIKELKKADKTFDEKDEASKKVIETKVMEKLSLYEKEAEKKLGASEKGTEQYEKDKFIEMRTKIIHDFKFGGVIGDKNEGATRSFGGYFYNMGKGFAQMARNANLATLGEKISDDPTKASHIAHGIRKNAILNAAIATGVVAGIAATGGGLSFLLAPVILGAVTGVSHGVKYKADRQRTDQKEQAEDKQITEQLKKEGKVGTLGANRIFSPAR